MIDESEVDTFIRRQESADMPGFGGTCVLRGENPDFSLSYCSHLALALSALSRGEGCDPAEREFWRESVAPVYEMILRYGDALSE